MTELSKSTEDYLETIYNLLNKEGEATVKSIANYLDVSLPAVTSALKNLQEKKYVIYKSYEPVKLTKEGEKIAKDIIDRHIVLRDFLHDVLKLDEFSANEEACVIEHAISKSTIKKLSVLMDKIKKDEHFKDLIERDIELHLCDQKPGFKGKIKKISGDLMIKRRITEMGLTPGTKIEVIRKAPLGDPIEIRTRGFLLSLRHNEAHNILIEE